MDKRETILKAALELFSEKGFYGTSVNEVAQKADVGAGTIYRYFKDKEELVNELFKYWKIEMSKAMLNDLPTDIPARKLFHEIWTRMSRFAKLHPNVIRFLEFHHHAPYMFEETRALSDHFLKQFHALIEGLSSRDMTREAPPELLMAVLIGAFTGVVKASQMGQLELTPQVEELAEEICWEAIRR